MQMNHLNKEISETTVTSRTLLKLLPGIHCIFIMMNILLRLNAMKFGELDVSEEHIASIFTVEV
jgi:hypothetical protein